MNEWREVELGKVAEGVSIYRKGWQECKLGDVVVLNYGKSLPERSRKEGNIPVYSSTGITGWHNVALVSTKGLIVGRKGTIGKVYKSLTPFFPIDTAYYILPNDESYNLDFMFYLLSNAGLEELNEDSAVPGLNRDTAYSQNILLPPIEEQKAIASVLSALDDKIDLLQRQNRTLESLAQALFRHWFIDGAGADWEEGYLDNLVTVSSGKGLKRSNYVENGSFPVLGANGEIGRAEEYLLDEEVIFTGRVGTLGNIFISKGKVWLSDNTLIVKPKFYRQFHFVYFLLKTAHLEDLNVGSTQPLIRQSDVKQIEISIPPITILERFSAQTQILFAKIDINQSQICTLAALRDTLLPKLMSGEVRVRV